MHRQIDRQTKEKTAKILTETNTRNKIYIGQTETNSLQKETK